MTPDLRAAFRDATYGTADDRFGLADHPTPAPGRAWAAGRWAVVTAWNPGGERAGVETNTRAGAALLARVRAAGFSPLPAHNGGGEWREEALLIPGARLGQAAAWGGAFGQAAVLWGAGRRVALVWLDGKKVTGVERRWVRQAGPDDPGQV